MVSKTEFNQMVGRDKARPEVGRCSYYVVSNEGEFIGVPDHICHVVVRNPLKGIGLREIVTFFRQGEHTDNYANALINSKWLGDCFLTKDVEEGYDKGFSLDVEQPINVIRGALILLRSPYEIESVGRQFDQLFEWGWDIDECLYFSLTAYFSSKEINPYQITHGKCVDGRLRLRDVREGNLFVKTTPANVCAHYSNITSYVDRAFYNGEGQVNLIHKALVNHPNNTNQINPFGCKGVGVKFNQENMEILRDIYKELESDEKSLH